MSNVIHLAFNNAAMNDDFGAMLGCSICKNKTWTFVCDRPDGGFPICKCAACGQHAGRIGWAHDDDPVLNT